VRDRAIALCEKLDDKSRLFPSLYGQFVFCTTGGKIPGAFEYAERCQSLAAQTGDRVMRLMAHRAMGSALLELGECEAARVQLEQVPALYDPEKDRTLSAQYVTDPCASAYTFLALAVWVLGYPDRAVTMREKAFKHAVDAGHANTSGFVSVYAGAQFSVLLGNMDDVRGHLENLNARPEGQMPHWANISRILMGWVNGCAAQPEEGISLMEKGMRAGENLGAGYGAYGIHWPHYVSLFAIMQARTGKLQDSMSTIDKAKKLIADTEEYFWHAEVLRIEGELGLLFGTSAKQAEACFVQALRVAGKQQARSFELRAATSLARLWRDQGKRDEARELLAPVYGWFTEGFDTRDLKEAKSLLEQLQA
jgi:predicted ATPase